jgi:hypothetical protein
MKLSILANAGLKGNQGFPGWLTKPGALTYGRLARRQKKPARISRPALVNFYGVDLSQRQG